MQGAMPCVANDVQEAWKFDPNRLEVESLLVVERVVYTTAEGHDLGMRAANV